ncbi:uncharacterized protein LAESUDRAFT_662285 [Laetiporus sulphureus 93-53]|uniref:Uncharacterized protein n=1 Tax=Laetiporus sulphureus 93-53 TaxID=1314785 RepID=A0A165C4M0_9APHY|nr:uncharacterized protein LAESUDRAFT_662285 [Laetiporus sulphureus 93-53]KZT02196.1 hypothetical protein LAESUDRAFT_662285 [Laetiporus sulphureus 93-53]
MHLIALNIPDLLLGLWRGTLDCERPDDRSTWDWAVLRGETWKTHGEVVGKTLPYLPGSFDRPPRDPAEKLNSGYKAWEFLLYIFGMGPALFYNVLPERYWQNFCQLVAAVRILHQRKITRTQLKHVYQLILEFTKTFENLYYCARQERIHFCRQSIHALWHISWEVIHVGPPVYYTQWTMERTIGNLGEEIKQPSNPYKNLSEQGLRRAQENALKAMIPALAEGKDDTDTYRLPRGAIDIGGGYTLLRAREEVLHHIPGPEAVAFQRFLSNADNFTEGWDGKATKWARLRLPNEQIACSAWKENLKPLNKIRTAQNVKVNTSNVIYVWDSFIRFAEVQYYFCASVQRQMVILAMVSMYSQPDSDLLERSHNMVWVFKYPESLSLRVVEVKNIVSVVAMIPVPHSLGMPQNGQYFFLVEKPGLDVAWLGGAVETIIEE